METWVYWAGGILVLVAAVGLLVWWPERRRRAGYTLALRIAGSGASPLWQLSPSELARLTTQDIERLERMIQRLEWAIVHAEQSRTLLARDRPEDLDGAARRQIREIWAALFEPLIAVDCIKERYSSWYGIDYLRHPGLHARTFGLAFAALCAQVSAAHRFIEMVVDKPVAQSLFNEAMPDLGLVAGTYRAVQEELVRTRDLPLISLGGQWYDRFIAKYLRRNPAGKRLALLVTSTRGEAERVVRLSRVDLTVKHQIDSLKDEAFARWLPLQKTIAEWAGDTRVVDASRRLISDAQIAEMGTHLLPGDILIERRNWYLSNIGLPGFWPHAALYAGSHDAIARAFDDDPAVQAAFGKLTEHLARKHPAAWRALGDRDRGGHPQVVLEAVSEGVIASSLEHTAGADYVAALRVRLPKVVLARALDIAMSYFGRPYDFDFDFVTDDAVVCSELVVKAYEPLDGKDGLKVPYITVAGHRAVPPTEIVRVFAKERGRDDRQLDFVYFLDGRESSRSAVVAGEAALAESCTRPKWDVAQP